MALFEIEAEEFKSRLNRWQASIHGMVRTLAMFAKLVDKTAQKTEIVPYFTGALEDSFFYLVADGSPFIQVAMTYSSVAEDGYDYAYAQHENYYRSSGVRPRPPAQPFYLDTTVFDVFYSEGFVLLEKDYLSLFEL